MSLDNYYKFIKNNLDKINGKKSEVKKKNLNIYDEYGDKEEEKKIKKKNRFRVYNTETKGFLPELKKSGLSKNQMNYVLLNKDVRYQIKRSVNNLKKFLNKDKCNSIFNDYDYKNILSLFK